MKYRSIGTLLVFGLAPVLAAQSYRSTSLEVPSAIITYVWGVNNHGTIVGQFHPAEPQAALQAGKRYVHGFNLPGATLTGPSGINDLGEYVVVPVVAHSFILHGNVVTYVDFPRAAPDLSFARGINNRHEIVGNYEEGANLLTYAFLRERDRYISLDVPLPDAVKGTTSAWGIKDLGNHH